MAVREINRGDLVATKDNSPHQGRSFTVEALRYVGGNLYKIEGVDKSAASPMRTTIWSSEFLRVVRRSPKVMDWDIHRECELQSDGTYKPIERRWSEEKNYKILLKIKSDRRLNKFDYAKEGAVK